MSKKNGSPHGLAEGERFTSELALLVAKYQVMTRLPLPMMIGLMRVVMHRMEEEMLGQSDDLKEGN